VPGVRVKLYEYVNHSGGARGADAEWAIVGNEYGVTTIAHSFHGHDIIEGVRRDISDNAVQIEASVLRLAATALGKAYPRNVYVKKLLVRSIIAVRESDAVYAIGNAHAPLLSCIEGGTGWTLQFARILGKEIFFYNQLSTVSRWDMYDYSTNQFIPHSSTHTHSFFPTLSKSFCGIGTRKLTGPGKRAIHDVYEFTIRALDIDAMSNSN
jgi:hypothetical protein